MTRIDSVRKAVGAVIYKGQNVLLVNKVMASLLEDWDGPAEGEWDFPKGGIEQKDGSLEEALLRELHEETGSTEFKIVRHLEEKICFPFPPIIVEKSGFERQETEMFLVEYLGDEANLQPLDGEIKEARFFKVEEVERKLTHSDTKELWVKVKSLIQ
ncbi:NUDIX hydrolase [Bacillus tianshenii]|uniref:NUDIX domain-containing protein n=1 Tax=Sutcliffiella tianshenii TaxID=1463404 RepID=UPI001CD6C5D2|nr:NUDIX hydrolase [Bacillus tianshenii]MCA1318658.1 NUDIX hydrolase [Bacillus tianshenii]